jgi:hypothetical protein
VRIFHSRPSPYGTALAMVGAKSGDRVLVIGAEHPRLAAEIALVTGLNGQTTVMAGPDAKNAVDQAAADAGSLVDLSSDEDPASTAPFDIVVLPLQLAAVNLADREPRFAQAMAHLRSGGRVVVIDNPPKRRFGMGGSARVAVADVVRLLIAAGALAARHLATTEDVSYYEARRP